MPAPPEHNRGPWPPQPHRPVPETRTDMPAVPPPPPNYYPPLPPPSPQLPDFKPHRMSVLDKCLAWLMAFIVLVFGLVLAAHFLLKPADTSKVTPKPTTSSAAHHAKAKPKASACPSPSPGT